MTALGNRSTLSAMLRRIWSLLLIIVASSLVVTVTVHAQELPGALTIECSGAVHSDGDADQSQGDADRGVPHHHSSCHGLSLKVPETNRLMALVGAGSMRSVPQSDDAGPSRLIDPGLRPPAA